MVKAIIKTKSGTEMTIESDRRTVEEIVMALYRREGMLERSRMELVKRRNEMVHGRRKPISATDMILRLKNEGFFKEKRTLGDIQKELEKHGYIYPQSSLSAIVIRLLRKGELGRVREEKGWVYVQR